MVSRGYLLFCAINDDVTVPGDSWCDRVLQGPVFERVHEGLGLEKRKGRFVDAQMCSWD